MKTEILFVDGYNMIGAWPMLVKLKNSDHIGNARDLLLHELSNYAKYEGIDIRVVFDAQLVPGITKRYSQYELTVIFTNEGQTADSYIEKAVGKENYLLSNVSVATSDLAEQWIVFQRGATRKSANELWKDIKQTKKNIKADTKMYRLSDHRRNSPFTEEDKLLLKKLYEEMIKKKKN